MSRVSIVMVTYHTGSPLWLAVDSALAQPECAELVLVNNGNPEGVERLLAQRAKADRRIKLISGQGNVGFAKGCNLGAKAATSEYLLLLNPDCMLPPGALARALDDISRWGEKTLAGCFLANPSGSEQRGGRRGLLTLFNAVAESFGVVFLLPAAQRLNHNMFPMPEGPHEVPAISGSFMLLTRSFYQSLKGMDERYFLHMEDMDFCYRVHKAGGKVVCLPQVKVVHFCSTSEVSSTFVEKHKTRGFILYLKTHFLEHGPLISFISFGLFMRYYLKRVVGSVNRWFEPPLQGKKKTGKLVLLNRLTYFLPQDGSLTDKTVLLTGATGQLGLCLIGHLLARGAQVIAVARHTDIAFEHERLSWAERDLEKDGALSGAEVDIVIHVAGLTSLLDFMPQLVEGGAKRFLVLGCLEELEKARSALQSDKFSANRYEMHKNKLMDTAKTKNVAMTLLFTTGMYGVGLDNGITQQADIIRRLGKLFVQLPAAGRRQPVHVQDVAAAVMGALGNEATYGKTYCLGGGRTLTYRELVEQLFSYMGRKPRLIHLAIMPRLLTFLGRIYGLKGVNGDMMQRMNRDIVGNNEVAAADFGYAPRGFLERETGL